MITWWGSVIALISLKQNKGGIENTHEGHNIHIWFYGLSFIQHYLSNVV